MKTKLKQYAFWKYDLFPFILGGEVIQWTGYGGKKDHVSIKGYDGYMFKPIKVMDYEKGVEIQKKLEELKVKRVQILKTIETGLEVELSNIKSEINCVLPVKQ